MNTKLGDRCVSLARELATFDSWHSQLHFSFLCIRNKILTSGRNHKWRSEPLGKQFGQRFHSRHSEISVIKQFDWSYNLLPKTTLVNVRLNKDLRVMLSKPCRFCQKMLVSFDVGQVFYSTNEGNFERFL